jgi:hypothetical protein
MNKSTKTCNRNGISNPAEEVERNWRRILHELSYQQSIPLHSNETLWADCAQVA